MVAYYGGGWILPIIFDLFAEVLFVVPVYELISAVSPKSTNAVKIACQLNPKLYAAFSDPVLDGLIIWGCTDQKNVDR